jgi:hypothetical protein
MPVETRPASSFVAATIHDVWATYPPHPLSHVNAIPTRIGRLLGMAATARVRADLTD